MNQLSLSAQAQIIALLTEGLAIRAIERLTRVHRDTIMRLGERIGMACDRLHNRMMRALHVPVLQLDETWSFIHTKQHRIQDDDPPDHGDCYLWLAFDPQTKVIVSYALGKRTTENAKAFCTDVRRRIHNRPQITTDGFAPYVEAIEEAFDTVVDYAMVIKEANFKKIVHQGKPDPEQVSTSLLERCNLTFRMQFRRHARRINAHSKTLQHHRTAVALHIAFYHFCQVHETLRVTPAMEMGLTEHIWSAEELVERAERAPEGPPPTRPKLELIRGGKA